MASRTRTSESPSASLRAAVAALRSRRESWSPMSTPSAIPPSTTETEPRISTRSRSSRTAKRSWKRVWTDSTLPSRSGTDAHTSGLPVPESSR